jgi:hypothetical protein
MTLSRPISLPIHGALELLLGLAALAAPFALGFTPAGAVVAVLVGVIAIRLALDTTDARTVRVSTHLAFDYGLAVAAIAGAIPLAVAGDPRAGAFLGFLGLLQLALNAATRYSAKP